MNKKEELKHSASLNIASTNPQSSNINFVHLMLPAHSPQPAERALGNFHPRVLGIATPPHSINPEFGCGTC